MGNGAGLGLGIGEPIQVHYAATSLWLFSCPSICPPQSNPSGGSDLGKLTVCVILLCCHPCGDSGALCSLQALACLFHPAADRCSGPKRSQHTTGEANRGGNPNLVKRVILMCTAPSGALKSLLCQSISPEQAYECCIIIMEEGVLFLYQILNN